jgi:DUF4097 and DUF4098 domain-containing protein YvlB
MFGATWTTDVEVFVPHGTEIYVDSHNGRIQVSDISRRVEARSHNGSLVLDRMAGDVRVALHNGTATVNLAGEPSSIRRIDAECHNGDITVGMPRGFSASVSARTHNGGIRSDFPSNSRASYRDRGNQEFQIGSGGLRVSARTHNGSIRLGQL